MKVYQIGDSSTESIEFRANDERYALVHRNKLSQDNLYKTIIMNQREVMNLYQALGEVIRHDTK